MKQQVANLIFTFKCHLIYEFSLHHLKVKNKKIAHILQFTKFCKIFFLLFTICTVVKSKGKISQNFVAFSEYMNFTLVQKCKLRLKYFLSGNLFARLQPNFSQQYIIIPEPFCRSSPLTFCFHQRH